MNRKRFRIVVMAGAILIGFLVRLPGVYWGWNFPWGWYGHHPDEWTHLVNAELLISPSDQPRWNPHPYPKGMGATVAVPILAMRAIRGTLGKPPPEASILVTAGRLVSVLLGTASILLIAAVAWRLSPDWRIGALAAWILALGGLHVSSSHFFVADVAALFWLLLGLYLLLRDLQEPNQAERVGKFLPWTAFSFGVSFGLKLTLLGLPSLAVVALAKRPRAARSAYCVVFFIAGLVGINALSYSALDLIATLQGGVGDPYRYSRLMGLVLYFLELPSVASLPVTALGTAGAIMLAVTLVTKKSRRMQGDVLLVVVLPMTLHLFLMVFKLDHFPRHLLPFLPWLFVAAAWALVRLGDLARAHGLPTAAPAILILAYQVAFVVDGERPYIYEPRNRAAAWLDENVAQGSQIVWRRHPSSGRYLQRGFPDGGRPTVLVIEMLDANDYLSGISWRNSYPRSITEVFGSPSQERLQAMQNLFRGTSEYRETVRFAEGYRIPEYWLTDLLIGNRSRNYLTEVVIFTKADESGTGRTE